MINKFIPVTDNFLPMYSTELCYLMDQFGSDKGAKCHQYTRIYEQLFKDIRNHQLNIFELGIGTNQLDVPSTMGEDAKPGASLRAWRKYFPNAKIYSGDIDQRILFEEERIKTFYVDQTNTESIKSMWENNDLKDIYFDIIIDDGLHEVDANISFLQNSFHKLKAGGLYIIEDVIIDNLPDFIRKIGPFIHRNKINYFDLRVINNIPKPWIWDNCLAIFQK